MIATLSTTSLRRLVALIGHWPDFGDAHVYVFDDATLALWWKAQHGW